MVGEWHFFDANSPEKEGVEEFLRRGMTAGDDIFCFCYWLGNRLLGGGCQKNYYFYLSMSKKVSTFAPAFER